MAMGSSFSCNTSVGGSAGYSPAHDWTCLHPEQHVPFGCRSFVAVFAYKSAHIVDTSVDA